MSEIKERKPNEYWTDEEGRIWMNMPLEFPCSICKARIYEITPMNVMVKREPAPYLCESCRKGILKLIRPELEENKK